MATYDPVINPLANAFYQELLALYKRHNMAIVPTYGGKISFHDPLRIVPYDKEAKDYIRLNVVFDPRDFK